MGKYERTLFIFRRDLRLEDNLGLLAALESSSETAVCFVLDPRQIRAHDYLSSPAREFMLNSLEDLSKDVAAQGGELILIEGSAEDAASELAADLKASAVFVNEDYTPFSRKRDEKLGESLKKIGAELISVEDCLLSSPRKVLKDNGTPYTVYTPFYKRAQKIPVDEPKYPKGGKFLKPGRLSLPLADLQDYRGAGASKPFRHGGRREALGILESIGKYKKYDDERNLPAIEGTTGLAAHLKFGTVSAREVYAAVKRAFSAEHTLIRELYWRDFFSHIAFHFPHVFGRAFNQKLDALEWDYDQDKFDAWCAGQTGFPIVDAGMRQLNETGFMHNRVRMIVASFLTKDLHIDWRWGEKYFAQKLIDFDPAVNNGNWQWAASTGCDAQPYFRIFNPWLQQEKFDPDASYIKRWVPELANLSAKAIHKLYESPKPPAGYPKPMVDHAEEKISAISMFEAVKG